MRALGKISVSLLILFAILGFFLSVDTLIKTVTFSVNHKNIIINALPKSGSTYIRDVISDNTSYKSVSILPGFKSISPKFCSITQFFGQPNLLGKQHLRAPIDVSVDHLGPPKMDMDQLKKFTDRKIVHIRDPRAALLSYIHYINKHKESAHVNPPRPPGYYQLSFNEQLDWGIDNLLPLMVDWIENWLKYKESEDLKKNGFKILITTYDELVADQQALYNKILDFYNIPYEKFKTPNLSKENIANFRKGDDNEWREVFSEQQKQRIAAIVPASLLRQFNWEN